MEQKPTFESVWALLQENAQQLKQSEQQREKSRAEFEQSLKKSHAEFEKHMKESSDKFNEKMDRMRAEFDKETQESKKRIKELQKLTGSWTTNHGTFAEEYFFTAFEDGQQNFFGEKFDDIQKKVSHFWQGLKDEYDIVLYNHTSVALIEVKYKAHVNDIPSVIRKAETYRILFPNYKDFKIYLGLASLSFYPELEQECINQGIAIIKQVGNKVVMNDANLKVY